MNVFKKFLLHEIVLTVLIGIVALVIFNTALKEYYFPVFWVLLGIIATLTGIMHYSIIQAAKQDVSKFASKFLLVTGIKMIIYLVFIVAYAFLKPTHAKSFLISFLILYLLYTSFEVFSAVRILKKEK